MAKHLSVILQALLFINLCYAADDPVEHRKPEGHENVINEWERESMMAKPIFSDISRDRLFPRAKAPADTVYYLDVADLDFEEKSFITTAQGVINRKLPQLYLVSSEADTTFSSDGEWLKWLDEKGYINKTEKIESVEAMLKKYDISEVILIDPCSAGFTKRSDNDGRL